MKAVDRRNLLLALVLAPLVRVEAAGDTLRFGLEPSLSPRRLISLFAPVAEYLNAMGLPVELATAVDSDRYLGRIMAGEFDILLGAPHVCRFLQVERGYLPMLRIDRDMSASLLAPARRLPSISALRGRRVVLPEGGSMTVLLAEEAMQSAGIDPARDVRVMRTASQESTLLALRNGLADAAFVSSGALVAMPSEAKSGVDVVMRTRGVPNFAFVAHPRLGARRAERIAELILRFSRSLPLGLKFVEESGYQGLAVPTADELKQLDEFVPSLKRQFPVLPR
jgi:phosphonate transport system substrate-binding protein